MKFSKLSLQLILSLILLSFTLKAKVCPPGNVLNVNKTFEEECIACGDNCSTCFLMENKKPKCFFCKEGYYLDRGSPEGECKPCLKGCARCIGATLSKCSDTLPGFFYDPESNSLDQCDKSCTRCHSKDKCSGSYLAIPTC